MRSIIIAKAPTAYQLKSLSLFGMNINKMLDGSHYSEQSFENEKKAKEFLAERAKIYSNKTGENLDRMEDEISKGYLTLDAVTAWIEQIES